MMMELRIANDHVHAEGYVSCIDRESRVLRDTAGPFVEKISAGCFSRALEARGGDCPIWINHEHAIDARDYSLTEDAIGLRFVGDIYDSEVIEAARNGEANSWSFGFQCKEDSWETRDDNMRVRTLEDINLLECSILVGKIPAYYATTCYCRDEDNTCKEYRYNDEITVVPEESREDTTEEPVDDSWKTQLDIMNMDIEILKLTI